MTNAQDARALLRAHRYGVLSTLSKKFDGFPFGSITPYLVQHDGSLLILISTLAEHTKNIQADGRVSLICHNQRDPHIQAQGRVTLLGLAELQADKTHLGERYLRFFPEAEQYFQMHDFQFYRIAPQAIRYIGGFGRIHWVQMANYAVADAAEQAAQEAAQLAAWNTRPAELRVRLQQQHGVSAEGELQAVGWDSDGLDVRWQRDVWRLENSVRS